MLTSDGRAEEFAGSFTRRGASGLRAPILRIIPLEQDTELLRATAELIADPPDDVIVTTAIGFRGWIEAADAAGLAPQLLDVLSHTRLLARTPKARGAIRAAGLTEQRAAATETTAEVVERLLDDGVTGRRIAIQLHGLPDDDLLARLTDAGAALARIPVQPGIPGGRHVRRPASRPARGSHRGRRPRGGGTGHRRPTDRCRTEPVGPGPVPARSPGPRGL